MCKNSEALHIQLGDEGTEIREIKPIVQCKELSKTQFVFI